VILLPFIVWIIASALVSGILDGRAVLVQDKNEVAAYEKEMADHPTEALSIARRAAAVFANEEKNLYWLAVKLQEKHLNELSLVQAIELAETFEKKLEDTQAGRVVRINWLTSKGIGASMDEVRQLLGIPLRISFQIVYRRQFEQWTYEQPVPAHLTFSCTKGQTPRLQNVHSGNR
jgi:hypothetical protein